MSRSRTLRSVVTFAALGLAVSGCALTPRGTTEEQRRADTAGRPYAAPFEQRALPELSAEAQWRDILERAFLANGDLEAAYFQWQAALARVAQASAYPNVNLEVGFEYMFSSESMKSWDRTTITGKLDGLAFPTKVAKAGQVALADARAAGERLRAAKFDLQRQVLSAWTDYALMAERVRIAEDNVRLLRLLAETAANRVRAGAQQQDLLKAQIELQLAENELRTMKSNLPQMRAMLNAMMGRPADARLEPPPSMPAGRPLPEDDAALLAIGVQGNAELAALAREVEGRRYALERARMEYLPDFSPLGGFTGSVEQFVGAMVMLPTAIPAIRGAIREAQADLRRMEAMSRQTRLDRSSRFVATLYALRNSERQIAVFQRTILPAAELVLANSRQAYAAGSVGFIELIDSQRTLLEVREMIAEAQAARERSLAELEAVAGLDAETLSRPASATQPAPAADPESGKPPAEEST